MKLYLILISFLFSFVFFKNPKDTSSITLSLKATVLKLELDTLRIKSELINPTSDTIKSLTMSCSWWEFFIFDSKEIRFRTFGCDSNTPTYLEIPPHSVHTYILDLKIKDLTSFSYDNPLKIAFRHIPIIPREYPDFDLIKFYDQRRDSGILIWSNKLKVK